MDIMLSDNIMLGSSSVLTSPSSIKQPLLDDAALDSSSSSHQTRAEMRRQYKRRVEKSRLVAAASSAQKSNFSPTSDVEDRQGVVGYDTSLLIASTSDTDSMTNIPTFMTSTEQERTRSHSLQSLDEQIIGPAKPLPLMPNNSLNEQLHQQQQQQQQIESPPLPPKSQSVWSDSHRKDSREDRRSMRTPPPSKPPSSDRVKINLSPRPSNPKFKRSSTYESATSSTVVDDALMDRALYIRENLRKYEMQELAAEAERAAESGIEKFVGSASKYVQESPDQTPKYSERKQLDGMVTPSHLSRGLLELDPLEFTPSSYFNNNTKKIKVSSLRKFSDVVPNFNDMHSNIRFHLQRSGVDVSTLPEMGSRVPLVKNDTIESDAHSQALSVTGSIGSFSSYAASSLKGVVDLLGRSQSNRSNKNVPRDFSIIHKSSSAMSSFDGERPIKPLWEPAEEEERTVDKSVSEDLMKAKRSPPLFPPSVQMARSADLGGSNRSIKSRSIPLLFTSKSDTHNFATETYDSDDSSVELYGRKSKSPMNMSYEDNGNKHNQLKPALPRSRSAQAFPSIDNSGRGKSNNNVSFDDPLGCRSCSPEIPLLEKIQTKGSVDEKGAVLSLLGRIHKQLSVSIDGIRGDDLRNPMKTEEENKMFVSNYFYTEKDAETRDDANLKLDINHPRKDSEAYCVGYCADDDHKLVSSCETLGKFLTSALEWVSTKKSDTTVFSSRSESAPAFSNLYNTDNGHDREKRVFAPPRLSERCVDTMKFASENDLRQSKIHNEKIDCVVCDGFDLNNKASDNDLE